MDAAMNSAVSALQAQQAALSTVSDNLANSATTGYKAVKTQFNDLLTQQGVGINYPAGGVSATTRQNVLAQGLVQSSSSDATTDMAITGNGMFAVSNGLGGSQDSFTRNGAFDTDNKGNLVLSGTNYYLLGWPTDAKGNVTSANPDNLASLQNVNINKFNSSATATTQYSLQANLPAEAQNQVTTLSYQALAAQSPTDIANGVAAPTTDTTENISLSYSVLSKDNTTSPPSTVYTLTATSSNPYATISDTTNSLTSTAGTPMVYQVTVDGSGNITKVVNPDGTTSSTNAIPTFTASDQDPAGTGVPASPTTWAGLGTPFSQSSSISIYDSLGVQQSFPVTWTAEGNNQWLLTVHTPTNPAGTSTTGQLYDSNGNPVSSYSYNVTFNSDGTLGSVTGLPTNTTPNPTTNAVSVAPTNGSEPLLSATWNDGAATSLAGTSGQINVNLGTAGALGTGKTDGLSQFDTGETNPSISVKADPQNGVQYGQLTGVSVDATTGNVIASYDNGQKVPIYKIPVVTFPNENGLSAQNDGVYQQSSLSGGYTLNEAGNNGAGTITGQALEQSNVDTSTEFSNMISAQQAYSAASQVIGTDKQMFTSLIQVVQ
jgi:flagellar hook protein FlgE